MNLVVSDLDNTLIYSYKHDIGEDKIPVELYEGRQVSFMTEKSHELLKRVRDKVEFVPLTTRSTQQYERIAFDDNWKPHFALTGNGGSLLVDGVEEEAWKKESMRLIAPCKADLQKAYTIFEEDTNRTLDVRWVNGLFLFTKSKEPEQTLQKLKEELGDTELLFYQNGVKVYAVPKVLNKGTALQRLKKRLQPEYTIAAGDSMFDVEMLAEADEAFFPKALLPLLDQKREKRKKWNQTPEGELLSDQLLTYLSNQF